jgi:hypothetical protein
MYVHTINQSTTVNFPHVYYACSAMYGVLCLWGHNSDLFVSDFFHHTIHTVQS